MQYEILDTPIGPLLLAGDAAGLQRIEFARGGQAATPDPGWQRDAAPLRAALEQLQAYFAGQLFDFSLRLQPKGTDFQRRVWVALQGIPSGETISYGELAARIGKPSASRAVGAANGANPLPIVVPCHRVIGSTGALTGFGGGLPTKRWLLDHERRHGPIAALTLRP